MASFDDIRKANVPRNNCPVCGKTMHKDEHRGRIQVILYDHNSAAQSRKNHQKVVGSQSRSLCESCGSALYQDLVDRLPARRGRGPNRKLKPPGERQGWRRAEVTD